MIVLMFFILFQFYFYLFVYFSYQSLHFRGVGSVKSNVTNYLMLLCAMLQYHHMILNSV